MGVSKKTHNIGIAGFGKVGKALKYIIRSSFVYDPPKGMKSTEALEADYLFLCVPTPSNDDGSCDTSIVEEIISKSKAKINIVRSTVWVGFTDWAKEKFNKRIVFMPEYGPSDFPNHPFNDLSRIHWAVVGGTPTDTSEVADLWETLLYNIKVFQTQARTAELLKIIENAYFYSKLTFLNEVYDICNIYHIDYDDLRTMLTEDPRIESDHSFIHEGNRKISGSCLPKDLNNLIDGVKKYNGQTEYLETIRRLNEGRN